MLKQSVPILSLTTCAFDGIFGLLNTATYNPWSTCPTANQFPRPPKRLWSPSSTDALRTSQSITLPMYSSAIGSKTCWTSTCRVLQAMKTMLTEYNRASDIWGVGPLLATIFIWPCSTASLIGHTSSPGALSINGTIGTSGFSTWTCQNFWQHDFEQPRYLDRWPRYTCRSVDMGRIE